MALLFLVKWVRLLFATDLNDGCATVFVQKNGQNSLYQKGLCLCSDHKHQKPFTNSLNIKTSSKSFTSSKVLNSLFKGFIVFYQATISHFLGGNCRYYPSCSYYAKEAFEVHSFSIAFRLTFFRILSCHPFSKKNFYDPVPLTQTSSPEINFSRSL